MPTATIRTYADVDDDGRPILTYVLDAPEVDDLDDRDTVAVVHRDREALDASPLASRMVVVLRLVAELVDGYTGPAHARAVALAEAVHRLDPERLPTVDGATLEVDWTEEA